MGAERNESLHILQPELADLAARLDEEAHALRELGRYGQRALGEGENLVQALWGICDRLREVEYEIESIARCLLVEEGSS